MGGSRSQKNKPHKARFASKSSRNAHKVASGVKGAINGARRTPSNAQSARVARLARSRNIRDQKRASLLAEKRAGTGPNYPPRILALIPLSSGFELRKLKHLLSRCTLDEFGGSGAEDRDPMVEEDLYDLESADSSFFTLCLPQHKLRLTVIDAPVEDLEACLEVAKVADAIAFLGSAVADGTDGYINKLGKQCLSMLRAQGLPTVVGLMLGLADIPIKRRSDAKKNFASALELEFSEGCKLFCPDTTEECQQILRYLAEHRFSTPHWRNQRPFVMAQQLQFEPDVQLPERGTLQVSGYVRGRCLSVNQLVHVAGVGDFQFMQIDIVEDPYPLQHRQKPSKTDEMQLDNISVFKKAVSSFLPDPTLQESLVVENVPDSLAGEQTWPTEDELAKASDENHLRMKRRVLPKGTSDYQAAWIVDENEQEPYEDDGDDDFMEAVDLHAPQGEEDEEVSEGGIAFDDEEFSSPAVSVRDDDDVQSEIMDKEEFTIDKRLAELQRLKTAHAADEEFPDEVDTPMDVPARQRFAKYRGLKSFRTSTWDSKESLPKEYGRIFAFDNLHRTQKHVLAKAKDVDEGKVDGCICTGTYVRLHIKGVPSDYSTKLLDRYQKIPLVACGLLQHESKMSVLHFSIRKHESFLEPVKSKDSLIFHTGFRRYRTRPIFSTDDINMDKHKFERFLHPGRFSVASAFVPITFPPLPLVAFVEKNGESGTTFVAHGSLKSVDPDRIILKRIVLSGYPQRVSKQKAVVRLMFHNPEDVRWFKPLELWTKYGRRGRIREPVGTHGAMKCIFDGIPQQRDAVCVSLYKRVFPRWPNST